MTHGQTRGPQSVGRRPAETATAGRSPAAAPKGLTMERSPTNDDERPKKKVQRYSPDRLLREKITVPAESTLSTEKHRGRMMVRVSRRMTNGRLPPYRALAPDRRLLGRGGKMVRPECCQRRQVTTWECAIAGTVHCNAPPLFPTRDYRCAHSQTGLVA